MTLASLLLVLFTATPSSSEPVLLDFHADWCGPCRQMRPALSQLARKGYPIKSIDIDQDPDLREKYGVQAVPTFIVIDPAGHELGRTSGSQPAVQLARFYLDAKAKAQPPANSLAHQGGDDEEDAEDDDESETDDVAPRAVNDETDDAEQPESESRPANVSTFQNPKPWETVVRIRVLAPGSVGFGSGTIIHSSPEESLILTCAHIFKLDGRRQPAPRQFPRTIKIDLFDGKLHGERPAQVHFVESVEGQAVDYDFTLDVGLIRIRPGRRLPSARVVPAHWEPRSRMKMLTVGCSEGQDATAWHTLVVNPRMRGLAGNSSYQAIECMIAPKQGRSGGGLFTTDGYVAGVCNFAEPRGDHGLYATPRSIYSVLNRNNLMALYEPVGNQSGSQLASRHEGSPRQGIPPITIARGQSPDSQENEGTSVRPGNVRVPDPELLGIRTPKLVRRNSSEREASTRRMAWHPTPLSPPSTDSAAVAKATDLNLDSLADPDRFSHFESEKPGAEPKVNSEDLPAASGAISQSGAKSRWRPANSSGTPISESAD